jgi:hypothetical protein
MDVIATCASVACEHRRGTTKLKSLRGHLVGTTRAQKFNCLYQRITAESCHFKTHRDDLRQAAGNTRCTSASVTVAVSCNRSCRCAQARNNLLKEAVPLIDGQIPNRFLAGWWRFRVTRHSSCSTLAPKASTFSLASDGAKYTQDGRELRQMTSF